MFGIIVLFTRCFRGCAFCYQGAVSFQFTQVGVYYFHPTFLSYVGISDHHFSTVRGPDLVVRPNFPTRVVRVFRSAVPFTVNVVTRTTFINHRSIAPDHGLCANVPLMRFLFFEDASRTTNADSPNSGLGFEAHYRRFILRRSRARRAIKDVLVRLFITDNGDNLGGLLHGASFLNSHLTSSVSRVVLRVVISLRLVNCERRRDNDAGRVIQVVVIFRLQPT